MLAISFALLQIAKGCIIFLAVRAQAQRLVLGIFLLFVCQEESFVGRLGYEMDHTDAMIDVVAIKESDVLI